MATQPATPSVVLTGPAAQAYYAAKSSHVRMKQAQAALAVNVDALVAVVEGATPLAAPAQAPAGSIILTPDQAAKWRAVKDAHDLQVAASNDLTTAMQALQANVGD